MSDLKQLIQHLSECKEHLANIRAQEKDAKKAHDEAEYALILHLKESGLDRVSANGFTASYSTETVANVNDWEAFYDFVRENNAFYLLQKRIASSAFREMLQVDGAPPPGTEPMEKDKLSFRKV